MITFIVGQMRSGTSLLKEILNANSKIVIPPNDYSFLDYEGTIEDKLEEWNIESANNPKDIIDNFYKNHPKNTIRVVKRPGYEFRLEEIEKYYDEFKLIYMLRDPRAIALSRKYYDGNPLWDSIPNEDLYTMMGHWMYSYQVLSKLKFYSHVFPLKYERLVTQPEECVRLLCDFLEVDYDENMLTSFDTESLNSSVETKNHNKIYTDMIDKWKTKLDSEEIKYINSLVGKKLLLYEGYDIYE